MSAFDIFKSQQMLPSPASKNTSDTIDICGKQWRRSNPHDVYSI